jgi:hypothetical protein
MLEKILPNLSAKFSENVLKSLAAAPTAVIPIEIKARAIATLGEVVRADKNLQKHQSQLGLAFDEVFADVILSAYLGASCLDNPARIVLRRALETGIAISFLWDSPCAFYGWKTHDKDLNFRSMVEFLSGESYKTLLLHENQEYSGQPVIDSDRAEGLYRSFSNVTHGKWSTFEASAPDRFSHNISDWTEHLLLIGEVQHLLLNLWKYRFPIHFAEVLIRVPAVGSLR